MSFNKRPPGRVAFKRPVKQNQPLLDLKILRSHLEEVFAPQKDQILELNTLRVDPSLSFLYRTYSVEWPFERGNQRIRITVYKDLPAPYPEKLCSEIRRFLMEKGFDSECRFWSSFMDYKAMDPGRILRN